MDEKTTQDLLEEFARLREGADGVRQKLAKVTQYLGDATKGAVGAPQVEPEPDGTSARTEVEPGDSEPGDSDPAAKDGEPAADLPPLNK